MFGIGFNGKGLMVWIMALTALFFIFGQIPIVVNIFTWLSPSIGQTMAWFALNFWWIFPVEIFVLMMFHYTGGNAAFSPIMLAYAAGIAAFAMLLLAYTFGPLRVIL